MIDAQTAQEAPQATEARYPTCDAQWFVTPQDAPRICRRRAEWTATAIGHDGSVLMRTYACADGACRDQAAQRARQEREWATVEVRMIAERH